MAVVTPSRPRGRPAWVMVPLILAIAAVAAGAAFMAISPYIPSTTMAPPPAQDRPAIVSAGATHPLTGVMVDGELLVPVGAIRDLIDPSILWDDASHHIVLTTRDKVLRMRTGESTVYVNEQPVQLQVSPTLIDNEPYIPVSPVATLSGLVVTHDKAAGVVVMDPAETTFQTGRVSKPSGTTAIRTAPDIKSPIIEALDPGQTVYIFGEEDGWYIVRRVSGIPGYASKNEIALAGMSTTAAAPAPDSYRPWTRTGERINLTWEYVGLKNPDTNKIGRTPGVNVVSPTWLRVEDGAGTVSCRASPAYVSWAHSNNMEVWALIDNNFDPDRTRIFLSDVEARANIIRSVLVYSLMYDLDGINIDFENVFQEDAGRLVQFVRELAPQAHEQGLTVSICITVKSTSPNWSLCYDRKALGSAADYVMLMAYDEHGASSKVAGSVASFPWVEKGISSLVEEVPPTKVVLGIPFYTRVWREGANGSGGGVTQRAVSMDDAAALIESHRATPVWNDEDGQYVARFSEKGDRFSIWVEDEASAAGRAGLVKKYGLQGIASWRRGFENDRTWAALDKALRF